MNLVVRRDAGTGIPALRRGGDYRLPGARVRGADPGQGGPGHAAARGFPQALAKEQLGWLDELAPTSIPWPDGRKLKLLYPEQTRDEDGQPNSPELQVKLHECFALKEHPHICEGRLPVKLWLCAPDGKRLEPTLNWPAFRASYPKLKPALQKKHPGVPWPERNMESLAIPGLRLRASGTLSSTTTLPPANGMPVWCSAFRMLEVLG